MESFIKKYCSSLTNRGVDRLLNMTDCFKSGFLGTFGAGGLLLWNASAFVEREQKCLEQRHQQDMKFIEDRHKKEFEELKKEFEELKNRKRWF